MNLRHGLQFCALFVLCSCSKIKALFEDPPIEIPKPPSSRIQEIFHSSAPAAALGEETDLESEDADYDYEQEAPEDSHFVAREPASPQVPSTSSSSSISSVESQASSVISDSSSSSSGEAPNNKSVPIKAPYSLSASCSSEGSAPFEISGTCSHPGEEVLFTAVNESPSLAANYPVVSCQNDHKFKGLMAPWAGNWSIDHGAWTDGAKARINIKCPGEKSP